MDQKKLLDLVKTSGEEAISVTVSDVLPELVKQYGNYFVSETMAELVGNLVGAVFPRFNSFRLGYKQTRLERNLKIMIRELLKRTNEIDTRLTVIEKDSELRCEYRAYDEMLLDNICDEIQETKVVYNMNGYINLLCTEEPNFDMALTFFKTLEQLTELDIRVLKIYCDSATAGRVIDIMQETGIEYEQLHFVKEKLARFGLLQSRNDEISDENLEKIIKYLQAVEKNNKSKNQKVVRLPQLKKLYRMDSFHVSRLGREYIRLITTDGEQ